MLLVFYAAVCIVISTRAVDWSLPFLFFLPSTFPEAKYKNTYSSSHLLLQLCWRPFLEEEEDEKKKQPLVWFTIIFFSPFTSINRRQEQRESCDAWYRKPKWYSYLFTHAVGYSLCSHLHGSTTSWIHINALFPILQQSIAACTLAGGIPS